MTPPARRSRTTARATRRASSSARRRRTPTARDQPVARRRFFTAQDETEQQRSLVVGPTVVDQPVRRPEPGRAAVKVNGVSFQVVGVLESKGTNGHPGSGRHRDRAALDDAQPAHGHDRRSQPDRRPGALEQAGRRGRGRDRRDPRAGRTRATARRPTACSTRPRCSRPRTRRNHVVHRPARRPSPRSRCSSAASAS